VGGHQAGALGGALAHPLRPVDVPQPHGREVNDFVATDHIEAKRAKRLDRFGQFSVAAARLALEDAGIDLAREDRERVGAMMGTALGGVGLREEQLGNFLRGGVKAVDATLALAVFGGASSCNIAIEFGAHGPNSTNAMSCASGSIAIGEAFRQVRDGYADVMIAGGARRRSPRSATARSRSSGR
jgi:3-oxoacyl-[acyl-carrier-protein] synthase II